MRRLWAAALLAAGLLVAGLSFGRAGIGGSVPALAQPHQATALTVTADDVTVENGGRTLVARGHVTLTYRTGQATSDLLRFNRSARIAVLTGHALVTDAQGRATGDTVTIVLTANDQVARLEASGKGTLKTTAYSLAADQIILDRVSDRVEARGHGDLEASTYAVIADEITADRRSDLLTAHGHLTMFSPPDLLLTGERVAYDRRAEYAVVSGQPVVVESKEGRVSGDWMEMFRTDGLVMVHGPVQAEAYGATITGDQATVDLKKASAVFTGNVVITRRQGTVWTDRATILYEARRLIAEGTATHATFTDIGDTTLP